MGYKITYFSIVTMSNSVLPQEGSQQQVISLTRVVQKDSPGGLDVLSRRGNPT